jgi:RNA polymerase sigma-70 factor (ECF subfamily)
VRSAQASRMRDIAVGIRDTESPRDNVSDLIEVSMEYGRAQRALATISAIQREAVELIYVRGLSSAEAAELAGVKVGTIKTRLRDGLLSLRRELEAA